MDWSDEESYAIRRRAIKECIHMNEGGSVVDLLVVVRFDMPSRTS
jgi:hypothetical protein